MFINYKSAILLIVILSACAQQKAFVEHDSFQRNYTCQEILLKEDILSLDLEAFLDQSIDNNSMETCWKPLIKRCFDEGKDVNRDHVILAVKKFNLKKQENYFHKAVYRYFYDIMERKVQYKNDIDKQFLEAYCRYAIKRASSKNDNVLMQAKLICQRVDPWLYNKIFRLN